MRRRLIAVLVGVVVLVLAVQDLPLVGHLRVVERDRLVTRLERDAFILAGRVEEDLESGTVAENAVLLGLVERYEVSEDVSVVVTDTQALAVLGPDFDTGEDFSNRPEILEALAGRPETGERDSVTLGGRLFYVAVPVLSGDAVVGAVRITAPTSRVDEEVADRLWGLGLVVAISVAIAAFAALVMAWTVTRPLARLSESAARLAGGSLTERAPEGEGPSEVRSLARRFNLMAEQIELLVARQRAFAGTASHQLRTPLTALRIRLESLAASSEGAAADPEIAEHIDEAIAETDRLHRMIEGLLSLTRAEEAGLAPVTVDLAVVAAERVDYWAPLAEERGVELRLSIEGSAIALAVAGSIEQMIDNLIDNALDVAPAGSELLVEVANARDRIELRIIDEGPGLSEADREMAFDRFWRAPGATPGGSGLGLAIVRQLAESAGGTARLDAASTGGVAAVVVLRRP
ncbi:MAG: HAMP domain-containing protein [Actinobacteria bacterium]|nr:HAMP domain-containing protein [Actinomycetota bacterium]